MERMDLSVYHFLQNYGIVAIDVLKCGNNTSFIPGIHYLACSHKPHKKQIICAGPYIINLFTDQWAQYKKKFW